MFPTPLANRSSRLAQRCLAASAMACALAAALPAAAQKAAPAEEPQTQLARTELSAGMHRIHAQVAQTAREKEIGLMFRKDMPANEGMLFVFDRPGVQCFWMKNTLLPLTAAFVSDDGTITNLADMQPMTEDSHCSSKPVRYVLEMNQGWFKQKGIAAGTQLRGRPFTAP